MAAPEPDDPQDAVVARQYSRNHGLFRKTAQYWATVHAGASHKHADFDDLIRKLQDMGVDENSARVALSTCDWDITAATEQIFS